MRTRRGPPAYTFKDKAPTPETLAHLDHVIRMIELGMTWPRAQTERGITWQATGLSYNMGRAAYLKAYRQLTREKRNAYKRDYIERRSYG